MSVIILETLRVRPISNILDGSKAQAVKIDAVFDDSPKPRELAWVKPETFVEITGVNYKDRPALNQFTDSLRPRLAEAKTRQEAKKILEEMGLVTFSRKSSRS